MEIEKKVKRIGDILFPALGGLICLGIAIFLLFLVITNNTFDLSVLADQNGTVRIPVVFLLILIPVGYLMEFAGPIPTFIILEFVLVGIGLLCFRKVFKIVKNK